MRTCAGLSANAIACWARHALLYNCEPFRIHHSRLFYPAIAFAGHAFETVIAVWIVTWHSITPVLISALIATVNIPCLSDNDAILPIVVGVLPVYDQRFWRIRAINAA